MIEIGSRVKSLLSGVYSGIIGTVISFVTSGSPGVGRVIQIRIEEFPYIGLCILYKNGGNINFYEKDLELIRSLIDPTSIYQYCSKCDVLTTNKTKDIYICCDHKLC